MSYSRKSTPNITKGDSEWEGWGTALKPAVEPIVVARKPLSEKNVALNVLKWGTGGINIDACRVGNEMIKCSNDIRSLQKWKEQDGRTHKELINPGPSYNQGRFPANIILEKSYQQVYILKESFINLIPLLSLYYGNEYMFKLQEEISGLSLQEEGKSWKVLQSEMLQRTSESEIQRKESSKMGNEAQQEINRTNEEEQQSKEGERKSNLQGVLDGKRIQVSQQRRINSTTEDISKSNDKEMWDTRTQDSNGNTSKQTIKDLGR